MTMHAPMRAIPNKGSEAPLHSQKSEKQRNNKKQTIHGSDGQEKGHQRDEVLLVLRDGVGRKISIAE